MIDPCGERQPFTPHPGCIVPLPAPWWGGIGRAGLRAPRDADPGRVAARALRPPRGQASRLVGKLRQGQEPVHLDARAKLRVGVHDRFDVIGRILGRARCQPGDRLLRASRSRPEDRHILGGRALHRWEPHLVTGLHLGTRQRCAYK